MARLKKSKSRKQQVADLAIDYLKLKAVSQTAKGAGKAVKKSPLKRVPVLLAGAGAAVATVVVLKRRGDDGTAPA